MEGHCTGFLRSPFLVVGMTVGFPDLQGVWCRADVHQAASRATLRGAECTILGLENTLSVASSNGYPITRANAGEQLNAATRQSGQ
jgi:hypothetical protein